jgi:hypothetical protein
MNNIKVEEKIINCLKEAGKNIEPPKELLVKIITAAKFVADKKQAKKFNPGNFYKQSFIFSFSGKILISAGAALAVFTIFMSLPSDLKFINHSAALPKASLVSKSKSEVGAANEYINNQSLTSDDVDVAVNAILASSDDEDSMLTNDVSDESLPPDDDSLAIKNLIKNYDQE